MLINYAGIYGLRLSVDTPKFLQCITPEGRDDLTSEAKRAAVKAYVRYFHFRVGAALLGPWHFHAR